MKIYVSYESRQAGGGDPLDPDDRWTSYTPAYYDSQITGVSSTEPNNFGMYEEYDLDTKAGDTVFVVSVVYDSGSTFGQTLGHIAIEGAYKHAEDAHNIARTIKDDSYDGYKPWSGYFENMNYVDVSSHVVDGDARYTPQ